MNSETETETEIRKLLKINNRLNEEYTKIVNEHLRKIKALESSNSDQLKTIQSLQSTIHTYEQNTIRTNLERESMIESMSKLDTTIKNLQKEIARLTYENTTLTNTFHNYQNEILSLKGTIKDRDLEILHIKNDRDSLGALARKYNEEAALHQKLLLKHAEVSKDLEFCRLTSKEIDDIKQRNVRTLADLKTQYENELARVRKDKQDELDKINKEIARIRADGETTIKTYTASIEKMKASYDSDINLIRQKHRNEIDKLINTHKAEISNLLSEHKATERALNSKVEKLKNLISLDK
jgi:chromosome segregation ATPase